MSRMWKVAIAWALGVLIVGGLGLWRLWVGTGRGAPLYREIGWMCMEYANDPEAAAAWYGKAVRLKPRDATLRMDLGEALAEFGKPDEALAQYREAARLAPNDIGPWLGISRVERNRGDYEAALEVLGEARKRAANEPEVLRKIDEIADLTQQVAEADAKSAGLKSELAGQIGLLGEVCAKVAKEYEARGEMERAIEEYEKGARCGNQECRERLEALGRDVPPIDERIGDGEPSGAPAGPSHVTTEGDTP